MFSGWNSGVVAEVVVLDLEPGLAQTSVEVGDRAVLDVDLVPDPKTPVAAARVAVVVAGVLERERPIGEPPGQRTRAAAAEIGRPSPGSRPSGATPSRASSRIVGAMSMFATGSSTCRRPRGPAAKARRNGDHQRRARPRRTGSSWRRRCSPYR